VHRRWVRYVIQEGLAHWKQWINETLENQDVESEIAEFIHDTNHLEGIRKHTPELYEELQGIAKGAGVDFQTVSTDLDTSRLAKAAVSHFRFRDGLRGN
jgi:hypothetical protein